MQHRTANHHRSMMPAQTHQRFFSKISQGTNNATMIRGKIYLQGKRTYCQPWCITRWLTGRGSLVWKENWMDQGIEASSPSDQGGGRSVIAIRVQSWRQLELPELLRMTRTYFIIWPNTFDIYRNIITLFYITYRNLYWGGLTLGRIVAPVRSIEWYNLWYRHLVSRWGVAPFN